MYVTKIEQDVTAIITYDLSHSENSNDNDFVTQMNEGFYLIENNCTGMIVWCL